MESLTPLESAVLTTLLEGKGEVLAMLRQQLRAIRIVDRKHTGVGFFTSFSVQPGSVPVKGLPKAVISDVFADLPALAHGAGFSLFIRDGQLHMLEGFTYDEPWPNVISTFSVKFIKEPRDLTQLRLT